VVADGQWLDERAQLGVDPLSKGDHVAASYQQVLRERRGQLGGYSDDLAVGTALFVAGPADVAVVARQHRVDCHAGALYQVDNVASHLRNVAHRLVAHDLTGLAPSAEKPWKSEPQIPVAAILTKTSSGRAPVSRPLPL
jgi:hypothetical protein